MLQQLPIETLANSQVRISSMVSTDCRAMTVAFANADIKPDPCMKNLLDDGTDVPSSKEHRRRFGLIRNIDRSP